MIPKIHDTTASTERPRKTSAKRSFLSLGRALGGSDEGGAGRGGRCGGSPPSAPPASGVSPLAPAGGGGRSGREVTLGGICLAPWPSRGEAARRVGERGEGP